MTQKCRSLLVAICLLLILTGCGKSTIDKPTSYPSVTITIPQPEVSTQPSQSSTSPGTIYTPPSTATSTETSRSAAPKSVEEFLALLTLDSSYAQYTHQINVTNNGHTYPVGYQITTKGQKLPQFPTPSGVVLDFAPNGVLDGSTIHDPLEWIDHECARVTRVQVGPNGGSFTGGTAITFYWSGWSNPPAQPSWCG